MTKQKHSFLHKIIYSAIFFLVLVSSFMVFSGQVFADTIGFEYQNIYTINPATKKMDVEQSVTFKVNSTSNEIDKNTEWVFIIPLRGDPIKTKEVTASILPTIKVKDDSNKNINFSTENSISQIKVKIKLTRAIRNFGKYSLFYSTPELYEEYGRIKNAYIPSLSKDTKFETTDPSSKVTFLTTYNLKVKTPLFLGDPSVISVVPARKYTEGSFTILEYTQSQILENSVWIQYGNSQLFKFKIEQKTSQVTASELEKRLGIDQNQYKILLPGDAEYVNQKVYYTKFSPEPDKVEQTSDGNLFAYFTLPGGTTTPITIEGYILIDLTKNIAKNLDKTGTFLEIPDTFKHLTTSALYWEVDSTEIKNKAAELKGNSTSVLEVTQKIYNFVVGDINYDDKAVYSQTLERKGALNTLKGAKSVCMEYSDLFIALARATGIPARAAFGKGYDPNVPTSQQIGHQWAQVWIPKIGWTTVDTTWGESGRSFIGKDLDHALWFVRENSPLVPPEVETTSRITLSDLEAPTITVEPINDFSSVNDKVIDQVELFSKYAPTSSNLISEISYLADKMPGFKLVVIIVPAFIIILVVSLIVTIIKRNLKAKEYEKIKERKKIEQMIAEKKEQSAPQEIINKAAQEKIREVVTQKDFDIDNPFSSDE